MKGIQTARRILALVLAAVMLLGAVSCGQDQDRDRDKDQSTRATSMYLRRTEGTVSVEDDDGRELKPKEDMGLYSGYQVETERSSYAWIDLDRTKLTKLDERSEVKIKRKGDDLELTVSKGGLYFNITEPLDEDETLNIRTSTMTVGIRGTCGWVRVESKQEMDVYILEGTVECSATGSDGKVTSTTVTAGERARILREEETVSIRVERMGLDEIPEFVMDELEDDDSLRRAIQNASGLDLGAGGGGTFRIEDLANVSYVGDLSECAMTAQQAHAFAGVLKECLEELDGMETWGQNQPFLRTALFDAGDGIPVLWVVMGERFSEMDYDHIASENRFYQWNGRGAVQVLDRDSNDYWLVDDGLMLSDQFPYFRAGLYPVSRGRISEEPDQVYEWFYMVQPNRPTANELQEYVTGLTGSQSYNFRAATDYMTYQLVYGEEAWVVAALDGRFRSLYDTEDIPWVTADCILGHGHGARTDVSWGWYGEWTDGADMLAALTGETSAQPAGETVRYRTTSVYDPETYIRHTDLDVGNLNLELYYEIPVFPDNSRGYRTINRFFQNKEDEFFAEGGEARGMLEFRQETDLNETFATTYDAAIHTDDGELVSVTLFNYYHAGGPHPNRYMETYTFRADTGERLTLRDLIDGTDEEIKTMIADVLEPEYQLESSERESIMSYDVENIHFYVEDGSVWVYFNPYEISYYARGSFLAQLPAPLKSLH